MSKNYTEITLMLGSTIEEAVEKLLYFRSKGELVSVKFNGISLYSDTVTLNEAYMQIVGMTKSEMDANCYTICEQRRKG